MSANVLLEKLQGLINENLQASRILGVDGRPLTSPQREAYATNVRAIRHQVVKEMRAKYDAAQTSSENQRHWANADKLDPHAANSYEVRRRLRFRSRYEVIENNPYLKGCALTIANDFIGNGPKLQIQDKRIKPAIAREIELLFARWFKVRKMRQKLWRMRLAKMVDGESFLFAYTNRLKSQRTENPISLDFFMVEADQISSSDMNEGLKNGNKEVDGLRWDRYGNPLSYFLLDEHPGSTVWGLHNNEGQWVKADNVIHWFRQDRGWLRGIPEITPSLALCALLRRYTLAVVRAAEVAAEFSAVLETTAPAVIPNSNWQTDEDGNPIDDPFDSFPIEFGMFTTLPWGAKLHQMEAEQPTTTYDEFTCALLREIVRPLLIPFNLAAGTSKDANMSSAILDTHIYRGGQETERLSCDDEVISPIFALWWYEAVRTPGYLPTTKRELPDHYWRWDNIGLDHTDPVKVIEARKIAHDKGFLSDRDIQEKFYNRNVEDWQQEIEESMKFRKKIGDMGMVDSLPPPPPAPPGASSSSPKKKPTTKAKKAKAKRHEEDEDTVLV